MEEDNNTIKFKDPRMNQAVQELRNVCNIKNFTESFTNDLIDKFIEMDDPLENDIEEWCQEEFDLKVREELMRSITNFVKYLQDNKAL